MSISEDKILSAPPFRTQKKLLSELTSGLKILNISLIGRTNEISNFKEKPVKIFFIFLHKYGLPKAHKASALSPN